mmetsp:Transcript_2989/g.9162  ORF Transcript_2989/g.9162 Transcript_2989/m.9162 type:complete len:147 (-) Transcript_2989:394-834(-)|eukprot:CAMPEP_0198722368 /NCGR_PEP_ID=MMETSP1475-20131203/129_1 /TAXON_ID= ORGANISM="Unidentified sp., Strain CCMP1999" /NCGR_SAMPLE_ID=MMETSP1475 /ASSEMBLY_ACC=CAM_ASM_001111 /LENGTH=146 /DNA_ID=CAMNT_0044483273 /DNA_START=51 /DNA_END=491 /DNA_ORIENTATION=+
MASTDEILQELLDAARAGDSADIKEMLDSVDEKQLQEVVKKMNEAGTRPLHYASANGHVNTVELLLKYNARADVKNDFGNTPLHFAALNGHEEAVKLLLKSRADPAALNDFGRSAYDEAASKNHTKVKKTLMDHVESHPATDAPEE